QRGREDQQLVLLARRQVHFDVGGCGPRAADCACALAMTMPCTKAGAGRRFQAHVAPEESDVALKRCRQHGAWAMTALARRLRTSCPEDIRPPRAQQEKTQMDRRFALKSLSVAVALSGAMALPVHAQETIKVGVLHSLSGT